MITRRKAPRIAPLTLWTRRLLALIVAANYALVLFDLAYVPWRNFWLHGNVHVAELKFNVPLVSRITPFYDPIKGIEPHRETASYLALADELATKIQAGTPASSLEPLLKDLRDRSREIIDENPFEAAGKTGTLEKIKNRMGDRMGQDSSKRAFERFWSSSHLTPQRAPEALDFFEAKIRPLIETNYYRRIGENGEFIDRFWRLDLWFQIIFALALFTRIYGIKRRHPSLGWREALLWRWYDLLLFLPILRWLRVIPLAERLQSSQLLDLEPFRRQISRSFVSVIAGELIEVIAIQTINQIQTGIRRGDLKSILNATQDPYVDLNDTNEIAVLARRFSEILVYQVLPKVQPDLEALLQQNLLYTLQQLPTYRMLQSLPGFNFVPNQLTQQLASGVTQVFTNVSQGTYDTLAVHDPNAEDLMEQLVHHFTLALTEALSDKNTLQEIQTLLCDLLEEFKVNYVRRISEADFEGVLEEAQQLSRPPRNERS